jgi:magnesium transporter
MLINCVAYQDGKRLGDITIEAISDYVSRPECFVWVALKDPAPEDLSKMQEEFNLHELAVEDARHGHQRPKIEEYGESLFAVLHLVEINGSELSFGEVDIFAGPNYVLSVRTNVNMDFIGVRARCEREPHQLLHGPSFVFYALMDAIVDRYFPVLELLDSDLDQIEEQIFSKPGSHTDNIQRLYNLKQKVTMLKHAVSPLMDSIGKLYGGRVPTLVMNNQDYFRDIHDHLSQINTGIDRIRDSISTAIHANLSLIATEQSVVTKRLAGWAAIFAVATAFAGVWGMNFDFMPELRWRFGYPAALGLVACVCGYLYYRFRKSDWL